MCYNEGMTIETIELNLKTIDGMCDLLEGSNLSGDRRDPQFLSHEQVKALKAKIAALRAENKRLRAEHEALVDEVMGDLF